MLQYVSVVTLTDGHREKRWIESCCLQLVNARLWRN